MTRGKHGDDDARFIDRLEAHGLPVTTDSHDFLTLVDCVALNLGTTQGSRAEARRVNVRIVGRSEILPPAVAL